MSLSNPPFKIFKDAIFNTITTKSIQTNKIVSNIDIVFDAPEIIFQGNIDIPDNLIVSTLTVNSQIQLISGTIFQTDMGVVFDFGTNRLQNVGDPVNLQDVATKAYVDNTGGDFVLRTGDSMTGNLNMTGNAIQNVSDPVNLQDVATKAYVDNNVGGDFVLRTGDTMTGNLTMNSSNIVLTNSSNLVMNTSGNSLQFNLPTLSPILINAIESGSESVLQMNANQLDIRNIQIQDDTPTFTITTVNNSDTNGNPFRIGTQQDGDLELITQSNTQMRFNNGDNTISMFNNSLLNVGNIQIIEKPFTDPSISIPAGLTKGTLISSTIRSMFIFHNDGDLVQITTSLVVQILNSDTTNSYTITLQDQSSTGNIFGFSDDYTTGGVFEYSIVGYSITDASIATTTYDNGIGRLGRLTNGFEIDIRERDSISLISIPPASGGGTVTDSILQINGTLTYILRRVV